VEAAWQEALRHVAHFGLQLVLGFCVITDARLGADPRTARLSAMTTLANVLALIGLAAIRFGGRGTGGFVFMLFGLTVLAAVVWALTRSTGNDASRNR
jgi:hypothetical protein